MRSLVIVVCSLDSSNILIKKGEVLPSRRRYKLLSSFFCNK